MEDQEQEKTPPNHPSETQRTEPVRSRWTPKPEQILILETIFNSGMVNPPKDETVRIRKLLEKFGTVGDANVFYWFQNRRSRSRRRQRQIQASLTGGEQVQPRNPCSDAIHIGNNFFFTGFAPSDSGSVSFPAGSSSVVGSSSGGRVFVHHESSDENLMYSPTICQPQIEETSSAASVYSPFDIKNSLTQYGIIPVIINGVATEVPRGPLDVKAMFGQDVILFHSSGLPMAVNDYGILLESLQHGESYFLVPRQS